MSILVACLDPKLLTNRERSPRLPVRCDVNLLPLGIYDGTLTMPVSGKAGDDQMPRRPLKLRKASPVVPRRLTRSFARELRQASTKPADLEGSAEPGGSEQLDAQKRETARVQSASLALQTTPALGVSRRETVKNEVVSSASSHPAVIPGHSAMNGRGGEVAYPKSECQGYHVVADRVPYCDHSGKALREQCPRPITETEQEHEALVS